MEPKTHNEGIKWLVWIGPMAIIAIFFGVTAAAWQLGFFRLSGSDATARIVGAAFGFAGALVAAAVTFVGLAFQHTVEKRNEDLKVQTERRLCLEADWNRKQQETELALKTVGLLGTESGEDSSDLQQQGALVMLSHLGMAHLAIDLMESTAERREVGARVTAVVLDAAFRSGNGHTQLRAAEYLEKYAKRMLTDDGDFCWPDCLKLEWSTDLGFLTRCSIYRAFAKLLLARDFPKWDPASLNAVVVYLTVGFRSEPDTRNRGDVAALLLNLMDLYKDEKLDLPNETLDIEEIRQEVGDVYRSSGRNFGPMRGLAECVYSWFSGGNSTPETFTPKTDE